MRPLRIAIDASRATRAQPTGTELYAQRLIQSLIIANEARNEPIRFSLYFRDRPPADLFARSPFVDLIVIPFPRLWTHLRWAAALWMTRPDITFSPAHTLPFCFPGRGIVTVHDLGYKHFPGAHGRGQRAYLDITTRYSQSRASLVLADSAATAADLSQFYATPADKIRLVYPGLDADNLRASTADIEAARDKHELPERYFIFIGTLQPRKNIKRLVQAFGLWQRQQGDDETALVLAGAKGWLFDEAWLEGASNALAIGYIDRAEKAALLSGAIALVFPSLYEGFGFPALEAMYCGTPVIASNTSSLPELVGDAGVLVDPLSIQEIAQAMRRISDDESMRSSLVARGFQQAKRFTWAAAAVSVMDAFDELGGRGKVARSAI